MKKTNPLSHLLEKPQNIPSIPARHQSYGFEEDKDTRKLIAQTPIYPGTYLFLYAYSKYAKFKKKKYFYL